MLTEAMRAVIYTRVSADKRRKAASVTEQEAECRAVCEERGWTVVDVFTDNDRSASRYATKDRPNYRNLVDYIDAGRCDVLVVWESSRLTRDLAAFTPLRDLCRERGVLWWYDGRLRDMRDGSDQREVSRDAVDNEAASADTSKRVQRNVRARAKAGAPHGRLTYGYRREYDPVTREYLRQVEDPTTGPIVREIFRRVSAGETLHAVTADLMARGIPGPRGPVWHRNALSKMVQNPAYIAQRVHRGQVVGPAEWPALVDRTTFDALQAVMTDPTRRTNRDGAVQWLLSGIAVCGVEGCGAVMVRHGDKKNGIRYACSENYHNGRRVEIVDPYVRDVVVAYLERPEVAKAMVATPDTTPILAAIDEKRARLDAFTTKAVDGAISPGSFATIEARLLVEIADLNAFLQRVSKSPALADFISEGRIAQRWDDLPMSTRREIIRAGFVVRILPAGRSDRRFDTSTIEVSVADPV